MAITIIVVRNEDSTKWMSRQDVQIPIGILDLWKDVFIVIELPLICNTFIRENLHIAGASLVFAVQLFWTKNHEVSGFPLHSAHEHGDP